LDPGDRDVVAGARSGLRRVNDDVLRRRADRVLENRDDLGISGLSGVNDGDAAVRHLRAEAVLAARRRVLEPPVADVRIALVEPYVRVEPTAVEIRVTDNRHVLRLSGLLAAAVDLLRLRKEVPLVLQ
jgi:hypothetical protein